MPSPVNPNDSSNSWGWSWETTTQLYRISSWPKCQERLLKDTKRATDKEDEQVWLYQIKNFCSRYHKESAKASHGWAKMSNLDLYP